MTKYKSISTEISKTDRSYIKELDKYIFAAELRMKQEKEELEKEKATLDNSDAFAVQELAVKESDLGTLEERIQNLRLQRTIAVQNISQILLIKDGGCLGIQR